MGKQGRGGNEAKVGSLTEALGGAPEHERCLGVACTWDREAGFSTLPVYTPQALMKGHALCGRARLPRLSVHMDNVGP